MNAYIIYVYMHINRNDSHVNTYLWTKLRENHHPMMPAVVFLPSLAGETSPPKKSCMKPPTRNALVDGCFR